MMKEKLLLGRWGCSLEYIGSGVKGDAQTRDARLGVPEVLKRKEAKKHQTITTLNKSKEQKQLQQKENTSTKGQIEANGTPQPPRREPGPTTQTPYRNQHRIGCASHSYKEKRLTELLPRNHFQDESFTLSTKRSTGGALPQKLYHYESSKQPTQQQAKPKLN
ncbi:hypothetical protein MTR_4g046710 [Medicago truncatula]|uniref:Uncharacterized protein n=1 Tax=Medicago truncatula TaxID=3880 RepID=A0A072UKM4_MEDTR|nr:hypothetical protein MTR_4g046710 [Medicago truncatula]